MLQNILNTAGGLPTTPSAGLTNAGTNLVSATNNLPNFGSAGTNAITTLLGGGGANAFAPMLTGAMGNLTQTLDPYTAPNYTNPSTNPAEAGIINQITQSVENPIEGQFAAAGRDLSPDYVKAMSMGLSQGLAPTLFGQYNTNVGQQQGAASTLFGGSGSTVSGLSGLNQLGLSNMLQGISGAQSIPGLYTQPASAALSANEQQSSIPYLPLSALSSIIDPIAALGGQSSGTGTTQQSSNLLSTILGGTIGGVGAIGSLGGSGGLPALLAMSDFRTKEDVKPIGMLFDGQNVYSFKYKADPTHRTHVGLMAQEVEQTKPHAVHEIGGIKFVDYDAATRKAA